MYYLWRKISIQNQTNSVMNISYDLNKTCNCYEAFVNNPNDRKYMKTFNKMFCKEIMGSVIKLHQRLKAYETASMYNAIAGSDNKIELKSGTGSKDNLVLKVRINKEYRKFFYYVVSTGDCVLTNEWKGQFNEVKDICVFDVNKHEYKK